MKRLLVPAVALLAFLAPAVARGATPAAIDCNAYVVDQAGVLEDGTGAQQAATKLQNGGADPRVVFIDSFAPLASVDEFEQALVKRCASWRSADGQRKNNLVALIVSMKERKAVISWGERWDSSLAGASDRIRVDFLNPALADGQYGQAVSDTFGEIGRVLDAQLHPPAQSPTTVVEKPAKAASLRPLWIILFVLAGIGLATVCFFVLRAHLRARTRRKEARQEALAASARASDAALKLYTAHDELKAALAMVAGTIGAKESAQLKEAGDSAAAAVAAFVAGYSELNDAKTDAELEHTTKEYQAIATAQDAAAAKAADALVPVQDAQKLVDRLVQLASSLPTEMSRSTAALTSARGEVAAAVQAGFKDTDMSARLADAEQHQKAAAKALAGKELLGAQAEIEAADTLVADVAAFAKGLPDLRAKLATDANGIALRIKQSAKAIDEARPVFEEISATYAEDSWKPVRGNGSSAEHAVAVAQAALVHAQKAASMEAQDWDVARQALTAADGALTQAKTLVDAIVALKAALEQAKASAASEIAAAEADIKQATEYEQRYDADIEDDVKGALRDAESALAAAKTELAKDKPNYLTVVKLAQQANAAADSTLVKCQTEHEQMERLRRQAASAVDSATVAIDQARTYIGAHGSDVNVSAQAELASADQTIARAHAADDLNQRIELAKQAQTEAENAYNDASSDVDDAEEERRRRASSNFGTGFATGTIFGSSIGHAGGGSFGGGGISSGGFGGGGGGMSSGGFGGGGGGSSSGGW